MRREPDGSWTSDQAGVQVRIAFAPRNDFGVLDHTVTLPDGGIAHVPMRVIANGAGTEVIFTLLRQPEMTDETFAADAAWVERDLGRLREVVEQKIATLAVDEKDSGHSVVEGRSVIQRHLNSLDWVALNIVSDLRNLLLNIFAEIVVIVIGNVNNTAYPFTGVVGK